MKSVLENKLRKSGVIQVSRASKWFLEGELKDFLEEENFFNLLSTTLDPDSVLLGLVRIIETPEGKDLLTKAYKNEQWFQRILSVIAISSFYTDFLVNNPKHLEYLDPAFFIFPENDLEIKNLFTKGIINANDIRKYYWGFLLSILAEDISYENPIKHVHEITRKITSLVDATVESALRLAKRKYDPDNNVSISVIAMGKTGSYELNYISDVDVIFLYDTLLEKNDTDITSAQESDNYSIVVSIINEISNICSSLDLGEKSFPKLWPLDLGLRPEGKDGALARTVESCKVYYKKWAKEWEFQALLKARHMAGNNVLSKEFLDFVTPLVWNISASENFVDNCRKMRKKVENNISSNADRNIKLGSGGIRDIEFSIQLLQLVHGRTDLNIRSSNTFEAIRQLRDNGYISRDNAEELLLCYAFLRLVEHRMQILKMQRSHSLSKNDTALTLIAKSIKMLEITNVNSFEEYMKSKRILVRKLHKDIFYSPILSMVASLEEHAFIIDSSHISQRLEAIGFTNPNVAIKNIEALTKGTKRRATIQRHLLPVLLEWMSYGANPDSALLNFRILSETVGDSHWYLGFLRDSNIACKYLCKILSNSAFIAKELVNFPEAIRWLENEKDLEYRTYESIKQEIDAILERHIDDITVVNHIRRIRAREFIRASIIDCIFGINVENTISYISMLNDLAIYGMYETVKNILVKKFLLENDFSDFKLESFKFAIISMGRLGGKECVYSSDADVLYVYDYESKENIEDSNELNVFISKVAHFIATSVKRLLGEVNEELPLEIDLGLRPEGNSGEVARSLSSYSKYFDRWTCSWERQALVRCRPIVGDETLITDFMGLVDSIRYGDDLSADALRQIRRLKARMDVERLPRRVKPNRHLKFGIGGLCDVEWAVQILQLKYAYKYPALRTTNTLLALDKLVECSIISVEDKEILSKAWKFSTQIRIANILASGKLKSKDNDVLPNNSVMNRNVNYILGNVSSDLWKVEEEYLQTARHCHLVYENLFFNDNNI